MLRLTLALVAAMTATQAASQDCTTTVAALGFHAMIGVELVDSADRRVGEFAIRYDLWVLGDFAILTGSTRDVTCAMRYIPEYQGQSIEHFLKGVAL